MECGKPCLIDDKQMGGELILLPRITHHLRRYVTARSAEVGDRIVWCVVYYFPVAQQKAQDTYVRTYVRWAATLAFLANQNPSLRSCEWVVLGRRVCHYQSPRSSVTGTFVPGTYVHVRFYSIPVQYTWTRRRHGRPQSKHTRPSEWTKSCFCSLASVVRLTWFLIQH